jgi:hypothetical protein
MKSRFLFCLFAVLFTGKLTYAKTVVFQESGFPTIDSQAVTQSVLQAAFGSEARFMGLKELNERNALQGAGLLVLPYGSAVPMDAWPAIDAYLKAGGNLLVIGGQPLHVPVDGQAGRFKPEPPQDRLGRVLDFRHSYAIPVDSDGTFAWREGYEFLPKIAVHAQQFFTVEGRLNGLGYMQAADGTKLAAPVIVAERNQAGGAGNSMASSRVVSLDFKAAPGYWESADGIALIKAAAEYAQRGPTQFWLETQYSTLRPGEVPQLTVHLKRPKADERAAGVADVELVNGAGKMVESARIDVHGSRASVAVPLVKALPQGFYHLKATYSEKGTPEEVYENGIQVQDESALESGPTLGVDKDFLTLDGKPFLPVGTNYFTTEENGWDFSGPRNALVWEKDFADMERHGVSFVRTGVWMSNAKFVEPLTGGVNERFLRNLEAYLAAAHRHHIAINFTFFAFTPHAGEAPRRNAGGAEPTPANPYLDAAMVRAEQDYVLSVVNRFKHVPWLSYDLINEPSFSNPRRVFHGNVPNGDAAELTAWRGWLRGRYHTIDALAQAWASDPLQLASFDTLPLPEDADMVYDRYGNAREVRALDYNLFAQDMFSGWAKGMVAAIHSTGSTQLVNVGQDEGGVTDRLLNRFYASSGVSFTTNHTYWQDDALLWDSIAAKSPGIPNITGETGYQPVWSPDGSWRYDELTGTALEERKWALGFAAGSSGAMQWDWAREVDFGIQRSDGSAKIWENMMRSLGEFAKQTAPYAKGFQLPQIAIVLPQSLQMSVYNSEALAAQQAAVRALYNYDRATAYAVGEYQISTLGSPKLIIVPSSYGLTETAWQAIEHKVREGAVLLISGPFEMDEHLHPTNRAAEAGLNYETVPLELREQNFAWAGEPLHLSYSGLKTTKLSRAELPGKQDWSEVKLGKGRILFSAFPLELNDHPEAIAAVYAYAIKAAGIQSVYTTGIHDVGILICPTQLADATLYVLSSESNQRKVSFHDERTGKDFEGTLEPGHAALLLIGKDGRLLTTYNWPR